MLKSTWPEEANMLDFYFLLFLQEIQIYFK